MKILVVEPGKIPKTTDIPGSLEAMQAIVGGVIQAIYPFAESVALICHEEGKLLNLSYNRCLCHPESGEVYDIVSGTFFLCHAPPDSDRFESLTPEQMEHYTQHFQFPELFLRTAQGIVILKNIWRNES